MPKAKNPTLERLEPQKTESKSETGWRKQHPPACFAARGANRLKRRLALFLFHHQKGKKPMYFMTTYLLREMESGSTATFFIQSSPKLILRAPARCSMPMKQRFRKRKHRSKVSRKKQRTHPPCRRWSFF